MMFSDGVRNRLFHVPRIKLTRLVVWISVSVAIDMVTMSVPLRILNKVQLRVYEKRILQSVFCATLIGTICCIVGIYGSFEIRTVEAEEIFYRETAFIMCTVIEIFAYALGASFPGT